MRKGKVKSLVSNVCIRALIKYSSREGMTSLFFRWDSLQGQKISCTCAYLHLVGISSDPILPRHGNPWKDMHTQATVSLFIKHFPSIHTDQLKQ